MIKFFLITTLLSSFLLGQNIEFIDPKDIQRGMLLQSKTRMSGNVMHEYTLRVISVLKGRQVGTEDDWMVMANVEDQLIEKTGVLAGMSGSPVYYDGKLLGAVSMTDVFQKKATIVYIRSIRSMYRMIENQKKNNKMTFQKKEKISSNMVTIRTPLMISGGLYLSEKAVENLLGDEFIYVNTPSSIGVVEEDDFGGNDEFVAGDALGVSMVTGDMNMVGIGTVTYVEDDYVLAFGHQMVLAGPSEFPLHLAKIDGVVPRIDLSYKVGTVGKEVGSIIDDRNEGILGSYKNKASKIPVNIKMKTQNRDFEFNFQVIRDPDRFLNLLHFLIFNSISKHESSSQRDAKVTYDFKGYLDNRDKPLEFSGSFNNPFGPLNDATFITSSDIANRLYQIYNNPYESVHFSSVEIDLKIEKEGQITMLRNVSLEKKDFKAGEKVKVNILLEKYNGQRSRKEIYFRLPDYLKNGTYSIFINSAPKFKNNQQVVLKRQEEIVDLESYIESIVEDKFRQDKIVLYMHIPNIKGISMGGKYYSHLPYIYGSSMEQNIEVQMNNYMKYELYDMKEDIDLGLSSINSLKSFTIQINNEIK